MRRAPICILLQILTWLHHREWAGVSALVRTAEHGSTRRSFVRWREDILLEHWPTEEGVGSMIPQFYSVRTAEWKYTEYSTGEAELYDLVNDPYELQNLAGKMAYKKIQAELAARLQELKEE
jgi:arylsulfatase A-like enzyme